MSLAEESSDDEEYQITNGAAKPTSIDESSDDESEMDTSVNWRDNLAQKARNAYLERQSNTQNLMKIVYGAINAVCERCSDAFSFLISTIYV